MDWNCYSYRKTIIILCLFLVGCKDGKFVPSNDKPPAVSEIFFLVNQERQKVGVPPLVNSDILTKIAQDYAEFMHEKDELSHDLDGGLVSRINKSGYRWNYLGENIASRYVTGVGVVDAWMSSSGHKKNILSSNFTETGIGVSSKYPYFYCQVFAKPRP